MSQILKTKTFIWSVVYFFYAKNPCSIAVRPLLRGHTISDSKSIVLEKKSDILLGGAPHFETVVYHYSFTLPTGNNKLLAAPLHQQRWRYKVWNHILRCCQSHVYTTVVRLGFVHFSKESITELDSASECCRNSSCIGPIHGDVYETMSGHGTHAKDLSRWWTY